MYNNISKIMSYDRTNQNNLRKEEKMFDNVGGKIKGVAAIVTWLGIISSVILFFVILLPAIEAEKAGMIALSFIILVIGCLISWLSSIVFYGFGQIIENSDIIAGRTNLENFEETDTNENLIHASGSNSVENVSKTFDQVVNDSALTIEQKTKIKELKEWKDEKLISSSDCRRRIQEIIKDQPLEVVLRIINKI